MAGKIVDTFLIYHIVKRIVLPFEQWDAFKLGIIDKDGKVLRKRETLTKSEELKAWGYFDILIANLKKLLAKVPTGSSMLTSTAAAMLLLREERNTLEMTYEEFTTKLKLLEEEVAVNNAGGGNIAGIGVGPSGEPGKTRRKKIEILKRIVRRSDGSANNTN